MSDDRAVIITVRGGERSRALSCTSDQSGSGGKKSVGLIPVDLGGQQSQESQESLTRGNTIIQTTSTATVPKHEFIDISTISHIQKIVESQSSNLYIFTHFTVRAQAIHTELPIF